MLKLLIILNFFLLQQENDYFISNIKGKVLYSKTKHPVAIGDKVHLNDELIFYNESDALTVISPIKGRFIIRKKKTLSSTSLSGFLLAVSDNIVPATMPQTLAGRGSVNNITDLFQFFNNLAKQQSDTVSHLLLIDTIRIELNKRTFEDRQSKFFFLRYNYNGQNINKKLSFLEQAGDNINLIIDRNILFVDHNPVNPIEISNVALYYYNTDAKESEKVASLIILFPNRQSLMAEIAVLYHNLIKFYNNDIQQTITSIVAQLSEEYGYIDIASLNQLLKQLSKTKNL